MRDIQHGETSDRRQRLWNSAFWASLMVFEVVGWLLTHQT